MEINISKADRPMPVDWDNLTPAVQDYVIRYGLTQILNDAHSTIKSSEEGAGAKAWALAVKKADAMRRGEVRSAGIRLGDPVKAEALRMAIAAIKRRPDAKDKSAKAIREMAMKYLDTFMARAKENVELMASLDAESVEIGDESAEETTEE